jgi:hypothetical protein
MTVRVDEDVYRELERRIETFADTPNTVLRRLLGLDAGGQARVAEAATLYRAAPWRLTGFRRGRPVSLERQQARQNEFTVPILETLVRLGGEARARDVLDEVGRRIEGDLTPLDREPLSNGEPRWRVSAGFERKNLVERGLLDARSPRGVWRITDAGRRWLAERSGEPEQPKWDLQAGLKAIDRVMRENQQWLQEMANR